LAGCAPLPQMEQHPARLPFSASYDLWDKHVLFGIGWQNRPKIYEIVPERSYVVDPSGVHHRIRVKPHDYDVLKNFPFIRDDVSVMRSDTDPKPITLGDGTWKFVLALRSSGKTRKEEFSFTLSTFYYNPISHGSPL
jgi:hypothetical protein